MQNWNCKIHPEAPHMHCACIRVEGAGNTIRREGDLTWPMSQCACDRTMTLNRSRNFQTVGAARGCPSNATVPECPRSSSETIRAATSEPQFDHLHSEDWVSRILIQAHWERSIPGPRDSQESLSQPYEDNLPSSTCYVPDDHQLSQRVYRHEGLRHCQVKELPNFSKKTPSGYSTPLPTISGSHLVKTNVTQNAPSHSLRSMRTQPSLPNMLPTGSSCEDSLETGHIALAGLVRLRALLAQCCQSLNSLCGVHQDAICCRHYYACAVVCWLLCIITTTLVLIAATAFRSNHHGD